MSLVRSLPVVFAPAVAGALLSVTSISTVILVDLLSYVVAIGTVFLVALPPLPRAEERKPISLWKDSLVGLEYIARHRGLAGMQAMLFVVGLLSAMGYLVLTPLVLSRTADGHGEAALGLVQSVGAVGGVLGALVLGALRPPANKMARVLLGILVFSVLGRILLGVGDALVFWTAAWFCSWLCVPFIEGYSMAIWQEKVPPAVQGRVFAASQLVQQLALPIGFVITGPLADRYLEPEMMPGGSLEPVFGHLVGTGPGAGMALVFLVSGVLGILTALAGFVVRAVRDLERLIPDANVA
jgi:MFS transporter, DHA3 family, macrolide efflux protein